MKRKKKSGRSAKVPARKNKRAVSSGGLATLIAAAAEDKKAEDIKIIDLKNRSALADFIIICTADSNPQLDAITRSIDDKLDKVGKKPPKWQGKTGSNWKVLDTGSIIVHVMGSEERDRYNLDELYEKSAIIYHL
jgi:ribosome-associated protein